MEADKAVYYTHDGEENHAVVTPNWFILVMLEDPTSTTEEQQ